MMYQLWIFLLILGILRAPHVDAYKNVQLQDYLCSDKFILKLQNPFRSERKITLTEETDSAAIITQIWNTTLPGLYSANKIKYHCTFRVKTPENQRSGIYIAVTRLKLRKNADTNECIDYIQFTNGNRSPSDRICSKNSNDGIVGAPIFDERDRDVSVHIHIDKRHAIVEPLEIRMVLTSHSRCKSKDDFLCDPANLNSCISRYFVHDNITNCVQPCRDETSCFYSPNMPEQFDSTNIAISAITSLISTMLGVGFCLWICWKYCNCIAKRRHAREVSAAAAHLRNSRQIPIELPTAPIMDDVITAGIDQRHHQRQHVQQEDPESLKDHPPSYESLFPDR